jgi:hypothetical protein
MSVPSTVKGGYFDVAADVTSLGLAGITGFVVICGLNTRNLTHQVNTSDEAVPDCGQPENVPWVSRNANSQEKTMAGTGLHNRAQTNVLRAMFGKTLPMRFIEGEPGNDLVSQGYWEGPFLFSNWQEGAADKANVTSQLSFVSDGEVDWHSSTAPALGTLALSTPAATHAVAWSSVVTGSMAGSDISPVSADGTILEYDADTKTVSGTFAAAGSKSVTLTEINPEATNSPKANTVTVTVS